MGYSEQSSSKFRFIFQVETCMIILFSSILFLLFLEGFHGDNPQAKTVATSDL